ncbi:hypothetical protein DAEQUDRAFT_368560 [Daedalea quercina L-15889]|uniref:Uncharacterized protein n=1 Tax=Daedalea quercina L-15889 TaxID=1314783 RepID=A0A165PAD2_9APHY|nr:hypothetical protein DAEQUDRAFT_368560 [Daedalea quercina L-15889]
MRPHRFHFLVLQLAHHTNRAAHRARHAVMISVPRRDMQRGMSTSMVYKRKSRRNIASISPIAVRLTWMAVLVYNLPRCVAGKRCPVPHSGIPDHQRATSHLRSPSAAARLCAAYQALGAGGKERQPTNATRAHRPKAAPYAIGVYNTRWAGDPEAASNKN